MGAYDGAEVAELIGFVLLGELKDSIGELDVGLYRDDGLAALKRLEPEL